MTATSQLRVPVQVPVENGSSFWHTTGRHQDWTDTQSWVWYKLSWTVHKEKWNALFPNRIFAACLLLGNWTEWSVCSCFLWTNFPLRLISLWDITSPCSCVANSTRRGVTGDSCTSLLNLSTVHKSCSWYPGFQGPQILQSWKSTWKQNYWRRHVSERWSLMASKSHWRRQKWSCSREKWRRQRPTWKPLNSTAHERTWSFVPVAH